MVQINLLPVREIKRRAKARQQIIFLAFGLVCLLVILAFAGFLQSGTAGQLEQELAKVKKDKLRYTKTLNQIKKLEQDKGLLEKRIVIIDKLKADSSLTVHILDDVARSTPPQRMWLTTLSQSGNKLELAGMALDNRTVASYMEDLKKSLFIQNVNLVDSSLQTFAGRNLKSFSLSCAVAVPAGKKEPEKKE